MNLFLCPHCGANLIEQGIREVLVGCRAETPITFETVGDMRNAELGSTDTSDFDDQWVVCPVCGKEIRDRTAIEIIEAFNEGSSPIRNECSECSATFGENVCDGCELRAGQCTGIREDKDLCQHCCAEEFRQTILSNPVAFILAESS